MTSCLSELKVTASICFTFKVPDNVTATIMFIHNEGLGFLKLADIVFNDD
jgi:hypothetical protein